MRLSYSHDSTIPAHSPMACRVKIYWIQVDRHASLQKGSVEDQADVTMFGLAYFWHSQSGK
ncbi:hypothetical protein D1Y84_00490 [Acidipila sp. EB88]|nr:hypothetical protein D1Y84_00030 [Acidipila sp. EB88]RRA50518.1 hypothetical protein D1Y84_00490 [Acidipila sp. EB88]